MTRDQEYALRHAAYQARRWEALRTLSPRHLRAVRLPSAATGVTRWSYRPGGVTRPGVMATRLPAVQS